MTNATKESLVVTARSGGGRPPIWSFHPIGGSVLWIRHLASALPADQPLYGIQARGLDGAKQPFTSIPDMAEHYVTLMREVQPSGPYRLCGASFGGTVAVEIAQQLQAAGQTVDMVAMFDTFGPNYPAQRSLGGRVIDFLRGMGGLTWGERIARARRGATTVASMSSSSSMCLTKGLRDLAGTPMVAAVEKVIAANTKAMNRYVARPYDGRLTLFRATERPAEFGGGFEDPTNGWSAIAPGRVDVIPVNADHRFILDPPSVHELAVKFSRTVCGDVGNRAMARPRSAHRRDERDDQRARSSDRRV